ncbi:hypothetical protein AK812_SmicGene41127 [Symbiodinium microadriaticum]|uniref:Transmembrane protein n=1 Tax=Symbiodinium microadriaticum TaxID=2951 RepID=A0A1Q9C6W4_SYMMI|nr:hypothetical protein AK812_SmicGene41127 [Symbiodinium microadriaticum]
MIWKRLNNHRIANGPFAATSITSLTSETQPAKRKRSPKKPTYPTLQGGEEKGISERSFWSCSMRSKVRAHKKGTADVEQQEAQNIAKKQRAPFGKRTARQPTGAAFLRELPWGAAAAAHFVALFFDSGLFMAFLVTSYSMLVIVSCAATPMVVRRSPMNLLTVAVAVCIDFSLCNGLCFGGCGRCKTGQENIANEKKNDMISVEGQAGHDKAVRHDAALASLEEEEDYSLYWLPVEEEEDEFLSAKDHRSVREDQDGDAQNAAAKPSQYYLKCLALC